MESGVEVLLNVIVREVTLGLDEVDGGEGTFIALVVVVVDPSTKGRT